MSFLHVARRSPRVLVATSRSFSSTSRVASEAKAAADAAVKKPASQASIPKSSCPQDTVMKGLNYLKGQPQVLALADDQYPEWLWTILSPKEYPDDGPGGKADRVRRKRERQQAIKDKNFMSTQ
ncbi:mitochondrial ribosomal protein L37-domain-containing protein [Ephemerocybe angulata]|uniref:Large ribosomal subunit protein mL54 n=1 Tax=Ephemerocybe angulata TaxID=980116 RepID=A0A8H6IFV5_9AGAR|nr:mitochondrial ribosomal protein L37-domain-containing protein [Tulosesus angulatus]